jgi:hypothetical protein
VLIIRFDRERGEGAEVQALNFSGPHSIKLPGEIAEERPDFLRAFRPVTSEERGTVGQIAATEAAAVLRPGQTRRRVGEEGKDNLHQAFPALVAVAQRSSADPFAVGR